MALLSQQLKNIANRATQAASQQQAVGEASNIFQTQQALGEVLAQPGTGPVDASALAQQMAPAITQQQGQVALQAQQQAGQQILQAGQAAAGQQETEASLALERQRQITEKEIAEKQLEGKLKQNSLELEKSKRMTAREIKQQTRMRQTGIEYDNRVSFLTRKQREDLAGMGAFIKQQVFDSRLQFAKDEQGRKFSNQRQLADYAVLSAENEIQLQQHFKALKQAHDKEMIMLDAAYTKINELRKQAFSVAEQQRDQVLIRDLTKKRQAILEKRARKKAQAAMIKTVVTTAFAVGAGAAAIVATGGAATPAAVAAVSAATAAGAGVGQGVGGAVS